MLAFAESQERYASEGVGYRGKEAEPEGNPFVCPRGKSKRKGQDKSLLQHGERPEKILTLLFVTYLPVPKISSSPPPALGS